MRDICDAMPMGMDSIQMARLAAVTAGDAMVVGDDDMAALAATRDTLLEIA